MSSCMTVIFQGGFIFMVMEVSYHKCMTMTSFAFFCHFFHVPVTLEGFATNKSSPYMWPSITVLYLIVQPPCCVCVNMKSTET